jgi:MscS family membrane protein
MTQKITPEPSVSLDKRKFGQSCRPSNSILVIVLLIAMGVGGNSYSSEKPDEKPEGNVAQLADTNLNRLQIADVSSPRATLHDFLSNCETVIEGFDPSHPIAGRESYLAHVRMMSMLDYSATTDGDSRSVMLQRALLLYEILSRIELPLPEQIPGIKEVSSGDITKWSVPETSISIQKIERGPQAGEFLFSARTVQHLPRFYREIKDLPYKKGVPEGVYERVIASENSTLVKSRLIRNILKPIETANPRSVVQGFTESVNNAYELVMKADAALKTDPPTMSIDEAREMEVMAKNYLKQAMGAFDLSEIPAAIRESVAIDSVLQLKEIIDRVGLPPLDTIPDMEMVEFEKTNLKGYGSIPVRWRLPDTEIEIVEMLQGDHQGQFLVSATTVKKLKSYYESIKNIPYSTDLREIALEYQSPGKSAGFYDFYIATPGFLIPSTSPLGRMIENLPDGFKKMYNGQTAWQWTALIISGLTLAAFIYILLRIVLKGGGNRSQASQYWRRALFNTLVVVTLLLLGTFLDNQINLTGSILAVIWTLVHTACWTLLALAVFFAAVGIAELLIASPKVDPEGLKASYMRSILGVFGFIAATGVFVYGLSQVGISLVPLLASLGIGGLAIALAIRPSLENVFGSFMIFIDKPFRVGQRVNVMGQNGTVEAIGLRSTKIRLLSGPLTSIPNKKLVDIEIENIARRPFIRRVFDVNITYDTPPEKITRAVELLREILGVPEAAAEEKHSSSEQERKPHPNEAINVLDYLPRVYFNDLKADSLNIMVFYWFHPAEYWDYLEHANWINIQIMERFNDEGIDFAFPTQTLHVAGDEKMPLTFAQPSERKA